MKTITRLIAVSLMVATVASCQKEPGGDSNAAASSLFDFATVTQGAINVNFDSDRSFRFDVYESNPYSIVDGDLVLDAEARPAFTANAIEGVFEGEIRLNAGVKSVFIVADDPQFGPIEVAVSWGSVTLDLSKAVASASAARTAVTKVGNADSYLYCPYTWDIKGLPAELTNEALPLGLFEALRKALPPGADFINERYLDPQYDNFAKTLSRGEVTISFVQSTAANANVLCYFTFDPAEPPTSYDQITPAVAFPNASFKRELSYYGTGGLQSGDQVNLYYHNPDNGKWEKEFPANTCIGFFVIANGFSTSTGDVKAFDQKKCLNTILDLNTNIPEGKRRQNVIFAYQIPGEQEKHIIIAFEDNLHKETSAFNRGDYDDVVFCLNGDFNTNLIILDPEKPVFPPADYYNYYEGTMAFEDTWPSKGDYDINDVVVRYKTKVHFNGAYNTVTSIESTYYPQAKASSPATITGDGFAIQLGVPADYITSIERETDFTNVPLGRFSTIPGKPYLEAGHADFATLILFDNLKKLQPLTDENYIKYTIELEQGHQIKLKGLGIPPFNAFAIPYLDFDKNPTRSFEVHFSGKKPTPLADAAKLGTDYDKSVPEEGLYYIRNYKNYERFPFAFDIPYFNYKVSKDMKQIDMAYPDFAKWAASGGTTFTHWYENPDEAYLVK